MQSHHFAIKKVISHIVMLGDSLSDRGTLERRRLLGIIPMGLLAGLAGKSPDGRFANGFVWSDDISAMLVSEFMIRHAEKKHTGSGQIKYKLDATDISDEIITQSYNNLSTEQKIALDEIKTEVKSTLNNDKSKPTANMSEVNRKTAFDAADVADEIITDRHFERKVQNSYTLDNDLYVQYRGRDFVRSYDEGGLTAHNYRWQLVSSVSIFFSRLILARLEQKRKLMLDHDEKLEASAAQKKQTLVIEWSGANDLVTVNKSPTNAEADVAIGDRINNVEKLIEKGYRNFYLFNLPDLSLTPRFQNMKGKAGEQARENGSKVVAYFNSKLQSECKRLQEKYQHLDCVVEMFDVCSVFTDIYNDTLNQTNRYPCHFEKAKIHIPYVNSKNFSEKDTAATGYMFWNDVHPTSDLQSLLANAFYKQSSSKYQITAPKAETAKMLCEKFKLKTAAMSQKTRLQFICHTTFPEVDYSDPNRAITKILKLALEEKDIPTRKAITDLQWIDAKGNINTQIPALRKAKEVMADCKSAAEANHKP